MKPFTVEELKEKFNVGDWVWVITLQDEFRPNDVPYGEYHQVVSTCSHYYFKVGYDKVDYYELPYKDYGKTWLVYKNKELAEDDYQTTMDGYLTQFGHNTLRGKKFIEAAKSRISKEVAKDILQVVSGIDETFKCRKWFIDLEKKYNVTVD